MPLPLSDSYGIQTKYFSKYWLKYLLWLNINNVKAAHFTHALKNSEMAGYLPSILLFVCFYLVFFI